jgi:copper transporter 1
MVQNGTVRGKYCEPMTVLATICKEMPGMRGCASYNILCSNTSTMRQCKAFPDIPG